MILTPMSSYSAKTMCANWPITSGAVAAISSPNGFFNRRVAMLTANKIILNQSSATSAIVVEEISALVKDRLFHGITIIIREGMSMIVPV